jgi:hypothetical protein
MPEQPHLTNAPILQTSITQPSRHPQEVTVQFLRFTHVGMTAYQKGQCAGFLRAQAEDMQRKGACRILAMGEPIVVGEEAPHAPLASSRQRAAA